MISFCFLLSCNEFCTLLKPDKIITRRQIIDRVVKCYISFRSDHLITVFLLVETDIFFTIIKGPSVVLKIKCIILY